MTKRSKQQRKKNKALLRAAYAKLGNLQAEHDPDLAQYYIKTKAGFLDRALDYSDPAIAFRGPKGVGKSAILRMIELHHSSDLKRIIRIGPDDLAFTALANADIDSPLIRSASTNQWLFKSLWNYILAIRLLEVEFSQQNTLFEKITSCLPNNNHKLAKKLLAIAHKEAGSAGCGMTEVMLKLIKEIELNIKVPGASGQAKVVLKEPNSQTNHSQLEVLTLIDDVTKTLPKLINNRYYVLIDDLDLHWKNDPVQNALIAALFSAMAKLRNLETVKFAIAIREDIYKHLPIEDKDKSRDWICNVFWDREALKNILENRMQCLHGISQSQLWDDLMPPKAFDTMLNGSLNRPRELIRQLALAFEVASQNGHSEVLESDLSEAVRRNSQEKLEELEQEFEYKYPGIGWVIKHLAGRQRELSLNDLRDISETIAIELLDDQENMKRYTWAGQFESRPKDLVYCLIDAGVLLVKTSRSAPPQPVDPEVLNNALDSPWFAVRPIYCPALMIKGT
jgi:hypothetical protein